MITASHLPYNRNGLKFFTKSGGLDGNDIRDILLMADGDEGITGNGGTYEERSYLDTYCKGLIDSVRRACGCDTPLSGKKIIVDAGNGAGGFFAKKVLEPLGANTDGSQFLEPDGTFPNHIPNPEDKQAIDSLKDAVLKNKAHLGIIFDTDVDRAGADDKYGDEINRNRLIALKDKKGTIVTDSVTSDGLSDFITNLGGKHVRYMRGYKHVIDEAVRRNALGEYCPLAIETSGHAAFKDNYFLDDGCYLVTRILICLSEQAKKGEDLAQLTSTLRIPKEEAEIRLSFNIPKEEAKQYGNKVIADLYTIAAKDKTLCIAPDNYEGIRINFNKESGDGWALVRMSVHDPIMPINIESDMVGGNKIIATKLLSILEGFPSLNTQNLINFVKGD
jgi:phosphomannomutase